MAISSGHKLTQINLSMPTLLPFLITPLQGELGHLKGQIVPPDLGWLGGKTFFSLVCSNAEFRKEISAAARKQGHTTLPAPLSKVSVECGAEKKNKLKFQGLKEPSLLHI